jgi:DNA replication protein DnaC
VILLPRRTLTERDFQRMRIPQRFREARLDKISNTSIEGRPSPQQKILAYGQNLQEMVDRGVGYCLWGANGVGKSSAAVAVMKEMCRRGVYGLFLEASQLVEIAIDRPPFDAEQNLWERAQSVPFLLLDDLGKGSHDEKGFQLKTLDKLIRHRSAERLTTWITTNLTLKDLQAWLMPSTLAAMQETLLFISIDGADRRADALDDLGNRLFAQAT